MTNPPYTRFDHSSGPKAQRFPPLRTVPGGADADVGRQLQGRLPHPGGLPDPSNFPRLTWALGPLSV